jgi:coenzyme F420-reducing hydrogenase delta subunit
MKSVGLEPQRIQMHYCSAAEGQKFQSTITVMSKEISELGPSPLRKLAEAPKKKKSAPKQSTA